jgi:LysR family nitrogen assimilation transcriptional regulator
MVGEEPGRGVYSRKIAMETIFMVFSPASPFAQSNAPIEFGEIAGRRLLTPCRPHKICSLLDEALRRSNANVEIVGELDCSSNLVELSATGDYESVLPWSGIYRSVANGTIKARPFKPNLERSLMLCTSDTVPLSDAATAVLHLTFNVIETLVRERHWYGLSLCEEGDPAPAARRVNALV